jgi:hypothetical protein
MKDKLNCNCPIFIAYETKQATNLNYDKWFHFGETRNSYRILVGKPQGKRPLGRPRRRWVDNIKVDLREIGWDGMNWIKLTQDRDQWRALVNTVMNLRVP